MPISLPPLPLMLMLPPMPPRCYFFIADMAAASDTLADAFKRIAITL